MKCDCRHAHCTRAKKYESNKSCSFGVKCPPPLFIAHCHTAQGGADGSMSHLISLITSGTQRRAGGEGQTQVCLADTDLCAAGTWGSHVRDFCSARHRCDPRPRPSISQRRKITPPSTIYTIFISYHRITLPGWPKKSLKSLLWKYINIKYTIYPRELYSLQMYISYFCCMRNYNEGGKGGGGGGHKGSSFSESGLSATLQIFMNEFLIQYKYNKIFNIYKKYNFQDKRHLLPLKSHP